MPHRHLEEVALRQQLENSAFGRIVAEILQPIKRYTMWHPHWFSRMGLQTGNVYIGSMDICLENIFSKVKIPLHISKLVSSLWHKMNINRI